MPLGREPVDLGDQADGADGDGPGRHRAAVGAAEPPGRRPDPLVVQERLAHPHEHDPGDPPPSRAGQVARLDPLVEDLPGREVAPGGHARRRAEDATHRAADLRREADADRPRLVQGDQHRLDRQAVVRPEAELLEAVDGRRHLAVRCQAWQRPDGVAQEAGDLEGPPPGFRVVDTPSQEGRAEPADRQPIRPQPKGLRHEGFGVQVAGVQHGSLLPVAVAGHALRPGIVSRVSHVSADRIHAWRTRTARGVVLTVRERGGNDEADGRRSTQGAGFAGNFPRISGRPNLPAGSLVQRRRGAVACGIRPVPILTVFLERIPSQEAITV